MDTRIAPGGSRLDVVSTDTAPRVTPTDGAPFRDLVARSAGSLVRGAEAAISSLPGAPIVAAAVRGGQSSSVGTAGTAGFHATSLSTGAIPGLGISPGTALPPATGTNATAGMGSAEGPAPAGTTGAGTGGGEAGSVEQALAQSQDQNLYYLQLQEQLSAENRAYSAMSNVLKTRHDTVKNAIGNIR